MHKLPFANTKCKEDKMPCICKKVCPTARKRFQGNSPRARRMPRIQSYMENPFFAFNSAEFLQHGYSGDLYLITCITIAACKPCGHLSWFSLSLVHPSHSKSEENIVTIINNLQAWSLSYDPSNMNLQLDIKPKCNPACAGP